MGGKEAQRAFRVVGAIVGQRPQGPRTRGGKAEEGAFRAGGAIGAVRGTTGAVKFQFRPAGKERFAGVRQQRVSLEPLGGHKGPLGALGAHGAKGGRQVLIPANGQRVIHRSQNGTDEAIGAKWGKGQYKAMGAMRGHGGHGRTSGARASDPPYGP